MLKSLCVGIACYNDAPTIARVVDEAAETARRIAEEFRVLAIDDGSVDDSPAVLRRLQPDRPWLECEFHEHNQGFGATFSRLYTDAKSEFNAILPGDGQIPADQLAVLAPYLDRFDLVMSRRTLRADSLRRRCNSLIYNRVISLLAREWIHDVNSVSIVRGELARRLELRSRSAFIHAEFFLDCRRLGARHTQVAILHLPRRHGHGTGGNTSVAFATLVEFLAYGYRKRGAVSNPPTG